ncbi:MAG TPA: HPr family phosphocarrier protein, partial [Anaerolineales bacterium]
MKTTELVLQNPTGLHARPAKVLVNLAKRFKSDIAIFNGEKKANAKSMVSVLTLGATCGTRITLQVNGEDEDIAMPEIEAAFNSGLGDAPAQPATAAAATTTAVAAATAVPAATATPAATAVPEPTAEPGRYSGVGAAPGIAVGPVFHFSTAEAELDLTALDRPTAGQLSLKEALDCAREQLTELTRQMKSKKLAAEAAIFEAHIELMDDPDLAEAVEARTKSGEAVPLAWKTAVEERAVMIAQLPDPLLSARADDMRDVGKRVLRLLLGQTSKAMVFPDHPVVIIARTLSPSDTAAFDNQHVLGFAIVEGGPTSHIAILARAMGLPAVV